MRFINTETTRRHVGFAPLIDALRQMFIEGGEVPALHAHTVGDGTRPGRSDAAQITLFKAVGSALEDLAAAE